MEQNVVDYRPGRQELSERPLRNIYVQESCARDSVISLYVLGEVLTF